MQIWTEKYRPKNFEEFKGQEKIVERTKAFVKSKNIPHMLFAGPAGCGKTTLALIIIKELFGDAWRENFIETNASDERGIDVIRNKVKDFARTKSINVNIPKIIYLDECDALTRDAQQALRRTMELYSNTARFILSCNYSSKLIDPIQSRCAIFKFRPLEEKAIREIIDHISKEEKLNINEAAIKALYDNSNGDIRRVENVLQSCAAISNKIDEKLIYDIISAARPKEIKSVMENAISGNFIRSRDLLLDTMLKHGLSGIDIIKQIQREIWNLDIDDNNKMKIIEKCGETEFRIVEGSDEFIQLESLLASVSLLK